MVFVLGPLAALAALQMAVCVSSRVNDARTAQQIGVVVILPVPGLLVGQLFGAIHADRAVIALIAVGLLVINAGLMWLGNHALRPRDDSDEMEVGSGSGFGP